MVIYENNVIIFKEVRRMDFNLGDIIEVIVTGIENYGIFVSVNDEYTGLIHISEIDNNFVKDINDYVKIGEKIYANIIGIDHDNKHLNLSIKNMNYNDNENGTRNIKESISGFLPLHNKLDEWIKKSYDKLKKEQ